MKALLSLFAVLLIGVGTASAATIGDAVEVSIVADNGRSLPFYAVKSCHTLKKFYAEAISTTTPVT